MSRVQRQFLLGSSWTAVLPLAETLGERHFEVVALPAGRGTEVTMRAILTRCTYQVPIFALEDRTVWQPGWQSLDA